MGLAGLIDELKNNYDEKSMEKLCPTPLEESKKFCDEKAKLFLEKKGIEERLREEVEFYSKYFKIESIIEKQKNTLQFQEENPSYNLVVHEQKLFPAQEEESSL